MSYSLFIAEKPSVAMEFAKALGVPTSDRSKGYVQNDKYMVTWCVGHLVTMSYPDAYDEALKKWQLETLPFIPKKYKYEVIKDVSKQYRVVAKLLNDPQVEKIYYSGDSAREGEYIQRLVRQEAGHNPNAKEYRVWIDSQTEEEIKNGIKNAHELAYYDSLSDSAYARAIEDYLVGINFSRTLSIKYSNMITSAIGADHKPIAVGRVMSCVLGMVVRREREIRDFTIIPFFGIKANIAPGISANWKIVAGSKYKDSPDNYNDVGLLKKEPVQTLTDLLNNGGKLTLVDRKESKQYKSAPLLFNLAEFQSECAKQFHINPSAALDIAQKLYEAKLTTYPRTDARVLTTAICKVITTNINGLTQVAEVAPFASEILSKNMQNKICGQNTKYVNDSQVSDHYAIIPTGQGFGALKSLSPLEQKAYIMICKRFLSIFYPDAEYNKMTVQYKAEGETFISAYTSLCSEGYLKVTSHEDDSATAAIMEQVRHIQDIVPATFEIKEGQSQPPKRYTSGSMILAMENAGKLIDDPELREQIKGSGIGTSATRADILKKLETIEYISVDKSQTIRPAEMGELVYEVLFSALPQILDPRYTASWEKGLQGIVDKAVSKDVYIGKIDDYIVGNTNNMKQSDFTDQIKAAIKKLAVIYPNIREGAVDTGADGVIGKCPHCGGDIKIGKFGAYCANKCGMSVGYIYGHKLTTNEIQMVLAGQKVLLKDLTSSKGNKYSAYFTPTTIEPYSYQKKDGTTVSGFQFKFTMEYADDGKKKSYSKSGKKYHHNK